MAKSTEQDRSHNRRHREVERRRFYRRGNQIFSVRVVFQPEFRWGAPELAFTTDDFIDTNGRSYDVTPDGQRLLVVKRARELPRNSINLIQNWTAALGDEE